MRKALTLEVFLKSLMSASSKCSAVWLSVRVRVLMSEYIRREGHLRGAARGRNLGNACPEAETPEIKTHNASALILPHQP